MGDALKAYYPAALAAEDLVGVPAFNKDQIIKMRIEFPRPRRTVRRNRKVWARYQQELSVWRTRMETIDRVAEIRVPKPLWEGKA